MAVSAAQGLGTGDLLDRLVELLPEGDDEEEDDDVVRLAVIGRPNVGKSSLVNAFLGRERVIVSEVAGTTRDAIDTPIEVDGRRMLLIDTAGIRRGAKIQESVEYFTTLRSQRAAERANVALVVCDATDGVTAQDLRIAELAMKSGCATALVLNKWDLTGGDVEQIAGPGGGVGAAELDRERARVNRKMRLRPKVLTASAVTGRNVRRLLQEALSLSDRAAHRIATPELNRFLGDVTQARQPPAKQGHRLKMLYMAQIGVKPPRFSIQVNSRARLTRDYAYFVENRLRERYGLDGIPLVIDFAERKRRTARGALEHRAGPSGGRCSASPRCCWRSRSSSCSPPAATPPPADGTARLVPPDALLYAHLSTSDGRTQDARLLALAGRFSAVRERRARARRGADARRRRTSTSSATCGRGSARRSPSRCSTAAAPARSRC